VKYRFLFIVCCFASFSLCANPKILIGIAGGTGSGKTTLAEKIHEAFPDNSILISQDSYYKDTPHLTFEERAKNNFDHPSSLDFGLLGQDLINLKNNQAINQPIYNFHIHGREKETKRIEPTDLIILEGILLFAVPEIRDLCDIKIFVDTDSDTRVLRRIERDMTERSRDFNSVKNQYLTTVKAMHDEFVEPSKKYADVIIPEGGQNQVALALIIAKLKEQL